MILNIRFSLSLLVILMACQSKALIEDKYSKVWKADRRACGNRRLTTLSKFVKAKHILKTSNQDGIIATLGTPDKIEIYRRGQKFYQYYYEFGKQCDSTAQNYGRTLSFRFDAIGNVSEIIVDTLKTD